jgi:mannosyltransferase OCH1-like enzyme
MNRNTRDSSYIVRTRKQKYTRKPRIKKPKPTKKRRDKLRHLTKLEQPIKVHFIWVGNIIPEQYLRNIIDWRNLNPDIMFFLWIDYRTIRETKRNTINFYNKLIEHNIKLLDVSDVFRQITNDQMLQNTTLIYETEVGLRPRVLLGDENIILNNMNTKNYGMASDILRILIVKYYGGFYLDTDLVPTIITQLIPKKKTDFLYASFNNMFSNQLIYFNSSNYKIINDIIQFITNNVIINLYNNTWNYTRYLSEGEFFREFTVTNTGPAMLDNIAYTNNSIRKLSWVNEKEEFKEHTWIHRDDIFLENKNDFIELGVVNNYEWGELSSAVITYLKNNDILKPEWNDYELSEKLEWIHHYNNDMLQENDGETKGSGQKIKKRKRKRKRKTRKYKR